MSQPISPQRLIHQAKALAGFGAGRGRPSPTDHRRGVSAAYYALFHALIAEAVEQVLPAGIASEDDRRHVARWINHADIKQASQWVVVCAATNPTNSPPGQSGAKHGVWQLFSAPTAGGQRTSAVPPAVRRIAQAFVDLQDARHEADYDHLAQFPKATAQRHVNAADAAIGLLEHRRGDVYLQRYLAVIVFRGSRLSRR